MGKKYKKWILTQQECGCQQTAVILACMLWLIRMLKGHLLHRQAVQSCRGKGNRFVFPY